MKVILQGILLLIVACTPSVSASAPIVAMPDSVSSERLSNRISTVVVDAATGEPLCRASVFNRKGQMVGLTTDAGVLPYVADEDFPLLVRYIGYEPLSLANPGIKRVSMREDVSELPEVVVNSSVPKALHILGYVREFSTLTTYRDTVVLFREKMVDFMMPTHKNAKFKGWTLPRMLSSRSYYHFRNAEGLDSVSTKFPEHFSWSDWIGITGTIPVPSVLHGVENATDTIYGKWCAKRIWRKSGDRVSLDADVIADTLSRRLVPQLKGFIDNNEIDFRRLDIRYIFDNCDEGAVTADNLSVMSYNIESRGRGRDLQRLFPSRGPAYVDTYVELYVIDKEYIPIKEARKWEKFETGRDDVRLLVPEGLAELPEATRDLIARVEAINDIEARLNTKIDPRIGYHVVQKWDIFSRLKRMGKAFIGIK